MEREVKGRTVPAPSRRSAGLAKSREGIRDDVGMYCPCPSKSTPMEMTLLAMLLTFLCLALHMPPLMHVVELA
eukprot:scaffold2871_cov333-Pavlova_lutheri.AAC.2